MANKLWLLFPLACGLLAAGCETERHKAEMLARAYWKPWTQSITNAASMQAALEARWSPEMLLAFRKLNRPTPNTFQNLVATMPGWRGRLYEDRTNKVGMIQWHTSSRHGEFDEYSLNIYYKGWHWIVELGGQKSLARPPLMKLKVGDAEDLHLP